MLLSGRSPSLLSPARTGSPPTTQSGRKKVRLPLSNPIFQRRNQECYLKTHANGLWRFSSFNSKPKQKQSRRNNGKVDSPASLPTGFTSASGTAAARGSRSRRRNWRGWRNVLVLSLLRLTDNGKRNH